MYACIKFYKCSVTIATWLFVNLFRVTPVAMIQERIVACGSKNKSKRAKVTKSCNIEILKGKAKCRVPAYFTTGVTLTRLSLQHLYLCSNLK